MAAGLGDFAVLDHQNAVRAADGGQPVGDDEARAARKRGMDGVLDLLFGFGIDRRGRLVQHEDGGLADQRACEGDQLLLPGGQQVSALAYACFIAFFQRPDEPVGADELRGLLHLFVGGVELSVADVVGDRAGEQVRLLEHVAEVRLQPELAALFIVHAVDQYLPLGGLVEAAQEVDDGGLARAGLADQGDGLARLDGEVEVFQHLFPAGILEGYVLKLDIAMELRPVLALGVEVVAKNLRYLGRIGDLRLGLDQRDHALGRSLALLGFGEDAGDAGDRLKHLRGVADEGCQRADGDGAEHKHVVPALPQQERRGKAAQADDQRVQPRREHRRADGGRAHGGGQLFELLKVRFLAHEGFGGFGAHDAFVERAGDLGVDAAHLAVVLEDSHLEIPRDHGHQRHHRQGNQRQLPVEDEHRYRYDQQKEGRPAHVQQPPRHGVSQALGIAGQPRDQVADGGLVVKRKRKLLQALEGGAADVAAQPHLHLPAQADEQVDPQRKRDDQRHVEQDERHQPGQVSRGGEAVDRLLFEQGKDDLDHRHEGRDGDDAQQVLIEGLGEAVQLLPRPQVK